MKHSLSELQDYLDVGQLDPESPDHFAVTAALEALPALLQAARLCLAVRSARDLDEAAAIDLARRIGSDFEP